MKQIQHNIRKLYKVKQANRHEIICQLRDVLADNFPKTIIRTDVKSFYESIPRKEILAKLSRETLLSVSTKKVIRKILYEYGRITDEDNGLPRGLGISAYLSELYMHDFDKAIKNCPSVIYYARYVDDIIVVFCAPPNTNTRQILKQLLGPFRKLKLKINKDKSKLIQSPIDAPFTFEYLGYSYSFCESKKIVLGMTCSKWRKYKRRVDLCFDAYRKKERYSEQEARKLLIKRIKFLTGNTCLVNNKKNVRSGIYFSNSLLSDSSLVDLDTLDKYLQSKVTSISNARLKSRLSYFSFKKGFQEKIFYKFSESDLTKVVELWKYA